MASVAYGPYEPDKSRFNSNVLPYVNNVVPTDDGWGPLPAIIPTPAVFAYLTWDNSGDKIQWENGDNILIGLDYSGWNGFMKLPAACTGFFAARKKDGTEVMFAGTATTLYKLNRSTLTWEDVSSTTYASACRWYFFKFGDKVYCGNGFNFEQKFNIESDTVFSDNAGAPICKYGYVIGNFAFRFNIVSWAAEPTFESPAAIMCSALEDVEDNVLQNYNWCDAQLIPTGDEIMGAVPVTGGAHIWLRNGVVPMVISMSEVTFTLGDVDQSRGTSAPYALSSFGQDRYIVYADDGFWLYANGFRAIGQGRINKTFLEACDLDLLEDTIAMTDPENAIIWLSYTNTDGERRMFGYQFNLDRFTQSDIAVSASFVARTFVYSESDPPIIVANQPRFTIIDEDGQLGYLVGEPMAATLTTNELQFSEGRSIINRAQLNGDVPPGDFTIIAITRDVKGGTPRSRPARVASSRSGDVSTRANGKTLQAQLDVASGATWSIVSGLDIPGRRAGRA